MRLMFECFRTWLFAALLAVVSVQALGQPDGVSIVRPDGTVATLNSERLMALPRANVTATAHDNTQRFEGSDLRDVLRAAGVEATENLRGGALRRVVSVHAADGYVAAFALAEIDASIGDKRVWLVNRQDGAALAADQGPWRLVVPADRRPARWVRQVVRIVVADGP